MEWLRSTKDWVGRWPQGTLVRVIKVPEGCAHEEAFERGDIVKFDHMTDDGNLYFVPLNVQHNRKQKYGVGWYLPLSHFSELDDQTYPMKKHKEHVEGHFGGRIKPLNDGSRGYRYNFGYIKGMIRVRKKKKRYEITQGKDMTGYHFGRFSLYVSRNKGISW